MTLLEKIQLEVIFTATRSGGPGGQHVNKTNSAALIHWDYQASQALDEHQKNLIKAKLKNFINKNGYIVLRSDTSRDLESNKKETLKKLLKLLSIAFKKEKPRVATKPTYSSKQKRHSEKKARGEIKKGRSSRWTD